ncbi:MAG TPA: pyridoxamine 5'-phosphate oxidase family protein [Solirubrobacteraceae bacterium]|nr:pyridoxamine 5'-phosphate oxidase family protein [Solirubrobacteraceae bacterium]
MSRRAEIAMSATEVAALLDESRTVTCATVGRDGWPHLMPLWYVVRSTQPTSSAGTSGTLWAWTYAKSQKVRNLERDPRCTLQVEVGHEYVELRGVMLACEAVIHRDLDTVAAVGAEIAARYGGDDLTPELAAAMRAQAAKRVGLQFVERRRASWDHRKLGGTY